VSRGEELAPKVATAITQPERPIAFGLVARARSYRFAKWLWVKANLVYSYRIVESLCEHADLLVSDQYFSPVLRNPFVYN